MKEKILLVLLLIFSIHSTFAREEKSTYFERIGTNVFQDFTHTFTEAPGIYKNMFAVPFAKTNLKKTGLSLGILGTSFLFDRSFNDFSRDEWEPICNKPVRHIRLPLPFLNLTHSGEKYWFEFEAQNSFHYDFVFLTFAQYGYVFGLLTENETLRHLSHDLIQATVYSFVFAQPIKPLIGRGRPYRDTEDWDRIDPWQWGHSSFKTASQYTAFPSFHSTFYSAYCTVLMDYLGVRWAGPILGSFFFFQQPSHYHWFSDIVAGQLFGYWLAASILDTPNYKTPQKVNRTTLFLSPFNDGLAVNLSYSF